MKLNYVDRAISRSFNHLGRLIARHPLFFVIPTFLASCILSPGLLFLQREISVSYLFGPMNGRTARDKAEIRSLFPRNDSAYDWTRSIEEDPFGTVIAVAEGEDSILSSHHLRKIIEIDEIIQGVTVQWNNTSWNYSTVCAINNGKCIEQISLTAIDKILKKGEKLVYPLEVYNSYDFFYIGASFGGVEVDDEGHMTSARAVRLIYWLGDQNPAVDLWQSKFLETVKGVHFDGIRISRIAAPSVSEELGRNSETVIPLCALAVSLMLLFGMCVCMSQDWVRAKPWMGVAGCVAAGLGVGSALGTLMYAGFPYCDLVAAVPYLMLGIGMDDSFVLLAAWRRTNTRDPVEKRLGETYSEAAVSITITSLTNFVSFLVGLSTPFPVVRIFCTYTAVSVLFAYIYQITFFGGCMALSGYREEKMLHPFTFRKVTPKAIPEGKRKSVLCSRKQVAAPSGDADDSEFGMMVFMRDYVGDLLTRPFAKAIVLVTFVGYLAVALVGCSLIVEGLEYTSIFPYDSYAIPFLEDQGKYFSAYGDRVQVVITEPIAYWDKSVQEKVEGVLRKFESGRYVAEASLTESWLRYFLNLTQDNSKRFMFSAYDLNDKNDFMLAVRTFLKLPAAKRFEKDIVFNHNGTDITASRFILQTKDVQLSSSEKAMLNYFYDTADESGLPISMYSHFFPISEQQVLVGSTSIQTICIAAAVMMVIFLIFIPNLVCAVCIAFSIVSIEVGVLGFMTLWSVRLDTISMINLIMCIGFSVDYSSHISYVFQTSKLPTSNEKIKWSLYSVGVPIVNGCLSTVLGVVILSFTPSYIFLAFFKIVFLVVVFAALHGMFLLPVLLGMFDSLVYSRKKRTPKVPQEQKTFDSLIERKLNEKEAIEDSDRGSCENGESEHSSNNGSENGDITER